MAAANAQIAEKLCGCERCKDAAARIRGQSRLSKVRTVAAVVEQQVEQQVGQRAEMGGTETAEADEQPAVGGPHRTRKQKENQRKKETRRRKTEAAMGEAEGQHSAMLAETPLLEV